MSLQKNTIAAHGFARLAGFFGKLQNLSGKLAPPPFRLLQIGSAFWHSRALAVAARLDVATVLGDRQLPAGQLAEELDADADALYRLLRLLTAIGVFVEPAPRCFANNAVSAYLRRDHRHSVRPLILMHNSEVMSRPWFERLEAGVRSGEPPFRLSHGQDLYGYLDSHADFDALFAQAMDSVEALSGDCFARDFDWSRFRRIIDVGGSRGAKSVTILRCHPRLRALVVDRPQVIETAHRFWHGRVAAELLTRLDFRAGDLFGDLPIGGTGDIYLLSAVFHGFDDDACIAGLRNLAAVGNGAPIALMELVVPDGPADPAVAGFDMQMFMGTRGRERTLAEWRRLAERSGLILDQVVHLRSFPKILVMRGGNPESA